LNDTLTSDVVSVEIDDSNVDVQSKAFQTQCIPHLISAYLIENAYKHGDKSHPEFLKIKVSLVQNKFELDVVNKFKTKQKQNSNGGVGLKNMEQRLALLLADKYEIKRVSDDHEYKTTLTIMFDND